MMDVSILNATIEPEHTIYIAARQCYTSKTPIITRYNQDDVERLISRLLKDGHLSPFEHVGITYQVEGISRACSHQLVRHRIASYTQQSQRYVTFYEEPEWVIPPSLKHDGDVDCYHDYRRELWRAWDTYRKLIRNGCPVEEARYILPNATPTNVVVTMNFRELLHFFELRCCKRAQWEIRELADKMRELAREIAPNVFKEAGPNCATCEQECPA